MPDPCPGLDSRAPAAKGAHLPGNDGPLHGTFQDSLRIMARLQSLHDSDLKLLRHFCTIVDEGGFSAAQSALGVSQSMLSESVKTLELRLGTALCQRGPKGFRLYPEGEAVYAAAQKLFAEVETFRLRASDLSRMAHHEITIAVQESVLEHPDCRLPEALAAFSGSYPNVQYHLEIMLGTQVLGQVTDGLTHLGICIPAETRAQVYTRPLFEERAILCCGRTHPFHARADAQLGTAEVAATARATSGRVERFYKAPAELDAGGDIGRGARAQLALILSGRNVGYVPHHIAEPLLQSGALREIFPEGQSVALVNPIAAMAGPSMRDIGVVRHLVDLLAEAHGQAVR
ncbi:CysJI operon transcriptional activator (plasmid) [Marinibacterium anthonyi]|nr:CysJI operon transcriptional activator [Marinibacterium anthonyi]